jgi:hypothetical protein
MEPRRKPKVICLPYIQTPDPNIVDRQPGLKLFQLGTHTETIVQTTFSNICVNKSRFGRLTCSAGQEIFLMCLQFLDCWPHNPKWQASKPHFHQSPDQTP